MGVHIVVWIGVLVLLVGALHLAGYRLPTAAAPHVVRAQMLRDHPQPVPAFRTPTLTVPIWALYAGSAASLLVAAIMLWRCHAAGRCPHRRRHIPSSSLRQ